MLGGYQKKNKKTKKKKKVRIDKGFKWVENLEYPRVS
jgi:hypothetical protein